MKISKDNLYMDWFDETEAGWYDTAFWSENTNECELWY